MSSSSLASISCIDLSLVILGGYVGHGTYGLELLSYLFAEKVSHPEKVFLLRVGDFNANEE